MKPTLDEEFEKWWEKVLCDYDETGYPWPLSHDAARIGWDAGIEAWKRQEPPNEVLALMLPS